jgi:hypothetical protein
MAMLSRGAMVVGALAVLLQSGCAERATRPIVTDVDLSLAASPAVGSPSLPVAADVRVSNVGNTRVWHCVGCGCGNGIALTVLGPDGVEVLLSDPNAPMPLCADGSEPLEPGGDLAGRLVFTGTLYEQGSQERPTPTYDAPPGTYTVVARFHYATSVPGEWIPLERRVTFDWVP